MDIVKITKEKAIKNLFCPVKRNTYLKQEKLENLTLLTLTMLNRYIIH